VQAGVPHTPVVRELQRLGGLHDQGDGLLGLEGAVRGQHLRQVASVHPLADDVGDVHLARRPAGALGRPLLDRRVVHPGDLGRGQRAGSRGGLEERPDGGSAATTRGPQHLHGDGPREHLVPGAPDDGRRLVVLVGAGRRLDRVLEAVPVREQVAGAQDGPDRAAAWRRGHGILLVGSAPAAGARDDPRGGCPDSGGGAGADGHLDLGPVAGPGPIFSTTIVGRSGAASA
jgi:hypothetical protein